MKFLLRRKLVVGACAVLCGSAPLIVVIFFHRATTDIFYPNGPTQTFNDFTPSDRTSPIETIDGVTMRPITASPVYLLFVPLRMSKKIEITLVARAEKKVINSIQMGHRTGSGQETNNTVAIMPTRMRADGWMEWTHIVEVAEMFVEERGARRLVFVFPPAAGTRWLVREVRLRYH